MCVAALILLSLRRRWEGCELGGPVRSKWVVSATFICYWVGFVGLVSWRVMRWGKEGVSNIEWMGVLGFSWIGSVVLFITASWAMLRSKRLSMIEAGVAKAEEEANSREASREEEHNGNTEKDTTEPELEGNGNGNGVTQQMKEESASTQPAPLAMVQQHNALQSAEEQPPGKYKEGTGTLVEVVEQGNCAPRCCV